MHGAGSDDERSRGRRKDDSAASRSASMEGKFPSSRHLPQKSPQDDEISGKEDLGATNSVLKEGDRMNVEANLQRPKRINIKNTPLLNIVSNVMRRKKSVADGFTAALSGQREARMKQLASFAAATWGEQAPQLERVAPIHSAFFDTGLFTSTSSLPRPAVPQNLVPPATNFNNPMDKNATPHAPLPIPPKPITSGFSTTNASADSSRRSSRRLNSLPNKLKVT